MRQYPLTVIIPLIISLSCLLFASQIESYQSLGQNKFANKTNDIGISSNISGITCDETEHLVYHNHSKLVITNQSDLLFVPANIGIVPNECIFWLHTHDDSGIIHVESPYRTSFSLEQFLQVWNSFDNSSIVDDILQNKIRADVSILLENQSVVVPSTQIIDIPLKNNEIIMLDIKNATNN